MASWVVVTCPLPVNRQTDKTENVTFLQTTYAGGKIRGISGSQMGQIALKIQQKFEIRKNLDATVGCIKHFHLQRPSSMTY